MKWAPITLAHSLDLMQKTKYFRQSKHKKGNETMKNVTLQLGIALVLLVVSGATFAGANADFNAAVTTLTNWLEGSLGQLIAIGAFGIGIVMGMARQSLMAAAVGIGIALAVFNGPGIITNIITAVI